MENENTEQTTADQEVPQPKKMSAKECVQQRLAGLASGAIQPVKRGPGRPRGPNYGKGWQSKMDPSDPVSVARAEAGRKGHATMQSKIQKEAWRTKNGRVLQAELDPELAALKEELKTYKYAEKTFDQKDTSEFVDYCRVILEDCIWNRKWPIERDNFYDELEVPKEERQFCSWWPEIAVTDVLIMARYVMGPDRPGLQKLAVKTMEQFLEWSKTQTADRDFEKAINTVRLLLPKVQDSTIYQGPCYDDPRLEPPQPARKPDDIWAERNQWALRGRDADNYLPRIEAEAERKLREAHQLEAEIIRQKQEETARALENQQRQLLGFDVNAILDGDVFGATARRR